MCWHFFVYLAALQMLSCDSGCLRGKRFLRQCWQQPNIGERGFSGCFPCNAGVLPSSLSPVDISFLGNCMPIYSICITCQWHGAGRTTWALWLLKVYISCTEEFHKMNFEMELSVRCLQFNIVLDFCSCFELFSCTASHLWFAIVLGT
jgi:hypothetical protein